MNECLVIRADGSASAGTGHIMRCLALAQGWRRTGGDVLFAIASCTPALKQRLRADGFGFVCLDTVAGSSEDAAQTIALARQHDASWVVADGYHFAADYQQRIKQVGFRLLVLDDYGHAQHYWADYVLNQNLSAGPKLYSNREPYTRLLLGTRYVLLREQFERWRNWKREIPALARKMLVTLGGSDPDNVTSKVIEAVSRRRELESVVVVGGSNPNRESLASEISYRPSSIRLVVDAPNMPELMEWADIAIAAGGTTSWELAFMGLPNVVIVLADNQATVAFALDAAGISVSLGGHEQLSAESISGVLCSLLADSVRRDQMSRRGRDVVDGFGVSRVIAHMKAAQLTLRRAREEDCRLIWECANDPGARAVSFSSDPISWETHVRWYASKLNDPNCFIYIATNGCGKSHGQIRFDLTGREGIVSLSLVPKSRGKGLGPALIALGAEQFFAESNANIIHAYIKPDNQASFRTFKKADFIDTGLAEVGGHRASHFVLQRQAV